MSANGAPTRLVLWDVDHTLIVAWDFHKKLYRDAFTHMTARPPERVVDMSGRPDRASATDMLQVNGLEPSEDQMERFSACLAWAMDHNHDHMRQAGRQAPGAERALQVLADRHDVAQTLVTGNLRYLAEVKLQTLGLDGYLDYGIGATAGTPSSAGGSSKWPRNAPARSTASSSPRRTRSCSVTRRRTSPLPSAAERR